MNSLLTAGNRNFDKLLMINSNAPKKEEEYYNERRERRNLDEFREALRHSSHSHLIEKIEKYEIDQRQLLDVIGTYDKKLKDLTKLKSRLKILEILGKMKNTKEYNHEREILCKTFDEAFTQ